MRRLPGGPVRAVLFDYGDTLVHFSRPDADLERAYTQIHDILGAATPAAMPPVGTLIETIHDGVDAAIARHRVRGDLREVDHAALTAAALHGVGIDVDPETLDRIMEIEQRAWWSGVHPQPDVRRVLTTLRGHGLRLGLCTNAPYRPASMRAQLEYLGIAQLVDTVTLSGEAGWRKPAKPLFLQALSALGCTPAETVMVGDRIVEDIGGAHNCGMRAIRTSEYFDDRSTAETPDAVVHFLAEVPTLLVPAESDDGDIDI